jgi:hypothetical protein
VLEKIHATKATPADTVFISTPDSMTPAQFRDAHRVIAHAVSTARSRQETLPKIIVLPPGSWAGIEQGRVQA